MTTKTCWLNENRTNHQAGIDNSGQGTHDEIIHTFSFFCQIICKGSKKIVTLQTISKKHIIIMANSNIELSLMDAEEKQQLEYIWNLIPAEDRKDMTQADVLMVLDLMDDYLVGQGLLQEEDNCDEVTYLEGEIDETEQLNYLLEQTAALGRALTSEQIQLIMDGELQYGIEQGYYEEE
jgi:hypothetical protein